MRKITFPTFLILFLVCQHFTALADTVSDRITVTTRGTGPDVVLIPGLACSAAVWDSTVTRLEGHYRLHLIQVAGFAGSPSRANAQGQVVQATADALSAYIVTNKLKAPKVIGHSMGGLIGLMVASQHPESIGKLLIVDSLPFFGVLMGADNVAAATPGAAMMRDQILNETQEAYAQSQKAFLPSLVKSPEGLKAVIGWSVASDKSVVARAMYEVMTTDFRPKLSIIKTPITILYPWDSSTGYSQATTDSLYQKSFAALPNKTLVRIDSAYHFIMLDQPEAFAGQMDAFLK